MVLDDVEAGGAEAGVTEEDAVITKVSFKKLLGVRDPQILLHIPIRDIVILLEECIHSEILIPDVNVGYEHSLGYTAENGIGGLEFLDH